MTDTTTNTTDSTNKNMGYYAVLAETKLDPHHNYTVLGRIIKLNRSDYDSERAVAIAAAKQAFDTMPETPEDILDKEITVTEVKRPFTKISLTDV